MAAFTPVNIQGAVSDVEQNSWFYQAELYREYLPLLPVNTVDFFREYDQKKDKSCVVFSAGGMISRNTGLDFTIEELREMWQEYQGTEGGNIFKTTKQIGQRLMLEAFPINMWDGKSMDMVLNKNWSVQVAIWSGTDVYLDAMLDGIMTNLGYKTIPEVAQTMDVFKHAIILFRRNGRTYLQNTWPNGAPFNIYDCTDVLQELIDKKLIRQCGMVVMPYSQDRYPGMKLTMKYYVKALARMGIQNAADVFKTFKEKYAKIDGVIDEKYRIR